MKINNEEIRSLIVMGNKQYSVIPSPNNEYRLLCNLPHKANTFIESQYYYQFFSIRIPKCDLSIRSFPL